MKMQGNTTEIDERNLLRLDALLSHGYGLSPQLVMRSKGLSIEAKALYSYLSSFAGAGDTAFPSTSRILEELDISKNRFYKIRKELISWGFISIETTATSAGLRTVYTLPQNPIAIKTEIDEIASRRNEIKSSLVANLHNEDTLSHKGDSESEHLQQSAGNEPCRQSEAKAQNRGSNLKPCLQSEDEGCLQSGDKLYIDTNINPKVSIDRSAAHPSDDEGPSDWKVTEGMTDPTQRDDGESDRDANRRDALDAVPDGTYDPLPTVADGYTLSNSEFEAFNRLCSLSIKTVRGAVRNEAAKQYAKRLGEGYSPATIEKAYIDYAEAYRQNNPSPRFAKQLSDWFVKSDGFAYFAKKPVIRTTTATKATSGQDSDLRAATEAKNDRLTLAATDPTFRDLEAAVSKARSLWGHACMGNMFQESGCHPTALNSSSGAYGICQWLGGRKTGLENLAKEKGKDMSDLSVQLDWFWEEFAESCSGWNKAKYKVFCAQSDLKQCVYLFRSQFERCGESEAADANRLAQAQRIYDALGTSNGTNGIDGNGQDLKKATRRQKDVVNAANTTKSPGQGWCAAWVTNVFQSAGIGYFGGNACDMCRAYCTSTNVRDLKVGMIIADVSHPGTGDAGRLYGHVGIYIGDNKVISNEGAITIKSLQEFVGFYGKGTGCKWGWLGGVDLSK